jgi:hypothetical protein
MFVARHNTWNTLDVLRLENLSAFFISRHDFNGMSPAYDQYHNRRHICSCVTKKTMDFCTFRPGDVDPHSQPPPGGPGASIESDISIKMPERETKVTPELVFNSNAALTNPHLNMSGILGPWSLQEHRIQSDTSGYGFLPTPAGHATATVSSNRPALRNQFGDYNQYLLRGTGDYLPFQVPMPGPDRLPVPLPGSRSEAWTKAQEDHLMESRKKGCTYPEIRVSMYITFGVDRNPNVLSKRCRMILERNAKDNVSLPPT